MQSNSTDDDKTIDSDTSALIDSREALRTKLWRRHPIAEDVQPTHIEGAVVGAQTGGLDVGKANVKSLSRDVPGIGSRGSAMTIKAKNAGKQPDLKHRLKAARVRDVDGKFFIPFDRLYKLITQESITAELQNSVQRFGAHVRFTRSIEQIAQDVCPVRDNRMAHIQEENARDMSRRRIFGILVSMGMSASIQVFLDDGLSDLDLPLSLIRHEESAQVTSSTGSKARILSGILAGYNERSLPLMRSFIERHQEFSAPVFAHSFMGLLYEAQQSRRLSATAALDFVRDSIVTEDFSTQARFGRVWVTQHEAVDMFELKPQDLARQYSTKSPWTFERDLSEIKHFSRLEGRYSTELFSQDEGLDKIYSWGKGGTLRSLLHRNRQSLATWSAFNEKTAKRFLGPSSHGRDHGDKSPFGKHEGIKPGTILWFKTPSGDSVVQYRHEQGSLQIANFGWLELSEAVDAMSMGALTLTSEVGHLGLAYPASDTVGLHKGFTGFDGFDARFWPNYTPIFDLHDLNSKSSVDDGIFIPGSGGRALRPLVSEFMSFLSESRSSSPWMRDLDVIGASLLERNSEARLNPLQLVQTLQEMQNWGRSHPKYFLPGASDDERMILSVLTDEDEQESAPAFGRAQKRKQISGNEPRTQCLDNKAEAPPTMIKRSGMKLVPCEVDHQMTILDKFRVSVEGYLDEEVDWWPLRPLKRPRKGQHMELRWEYGGEEMSMFLNQSQTEWFFINRNQAQGENHVLDNILPTIESRSFPSPGDQVRSNHTARNTFWKTLNRSIGQLLNNSKSNKPEFANSVGDEQKETYLCVDKCWTTIKDTRMRTVTGVHEMESDFEVFCRARNLLKQAEGNWLQRKLSWRSYTTVALSRFHFLWDDTDEVEVDGKPPSKNTKLLRGYEYTQIENLPIDVQMRLCATILLRGIANPELGRGRRQLLDGMPKLLAPPGLKKKQFSGGWGFHARQGLCMRKTMGWIGAVLAFGIAFVPYWLCAIDELDLQTALAPASFLATILGVGLAMLAIADTR